MTVVSGKVEKESNGEIDDLKSKIQLITDELERQRQAPPATNIPAAGGMDGGQFAELIRLVTKELKSKPDDQVYGGSNYVKESDIDPDDFDADGKKFCAYSTGYVIVDDVRKGQRVQTPFRNIIVFLFEAMLKTRNADGKQVLNTYSSYTSHSKKEQQWLKEHKYFGIRFFETHVEALNVDAAKANKIMRYVDVCMGYSQDQMILACKQHGVAINNDPVNMRKSLAMAMFKVSEDVQETGTQKMLVESHEADIFLGDKTKTTRP